MQDADDLANGGEHQIVGVNDVADKMGKRGYCCNVFALAMHFEFIKIDRDALYVIYRDAPSSCYAKESIMNPGGILVFKLKLGFCPFCGAKL